MVVTYLSFRESPKNAVTHHESKCCALSSFAKDDGRVIVIAIPRGSLGIFFLDFSKDFQNIFLCRRFPIQQNIRGSGRGGIILLTIPLVGIGSSIAGVFGNVIGEPIHNHTALGAVHQVRSAKVSIGLPVQHAGGIASGHRILVLGGDTRPISDGGLGLLLLRLGRDLRTLIH